MLAAAAMGVPTVAFEPNVVPGFANRRLAPAVAAAAVQFVETCRYFRNCRITGVPVRREFFSIRPKPPVSTPTLLVFGGSQGAKQINEVVIESLAGLNGAIPKLHIIHQTGVPDYDQAQAAYLRAGVSAEVSPFIENMPEAFSRADLLVCRSGASTVAEIMAAGKPAIFVPFPRAADDHQRRNAEALVRMGAALLCPQSELNRPRLVDFVSRLMSDRETLAIMGSAARAHARPNAARDIAALARHVAR
jgi:UDP-N-acetylglucosamine--N-acetylmuramyl-(pentapeptide) pyrophosphoryl-undecaprenol N-acetylglucosamine transferase